MSSAQNRPEALFPKLPPGRTTASRAERVRNQRERLIGAMIDAVGRNGFQATTVREVVALAGVSNRTFYENFDSMQDCFVAAFNEIVSHQVVGVGKAYASESGFPKRLRLAFNAYLEIMAEQPIETHLMMVDLISLGAEGIARRQEAMAGFELMISQSFAEAPELGEVSDLTVAAIVGGFQRVFYRRVRDEEAGRLPAEIDELLDWALAYQRPGGTSAAELPGGPLALADPVGAEEVGLGEDWDEGSGDGNRDRSTLTQHERIIRAAATITGERGFTSLSIPAITRAARVSNETFYEHFRSTQDAFLEAVDTLGGRVLTRVGEAVEAQEAWPEAVRAGLEELLTYLADNPSLARLLFIEAFGAGSATVKRVDVMLDLMTRTFRLEDHRAFGGAPVPQVIIEAIPGGVFLIVQREILQGRVITLPALVPELTFFVLEPFGAV